MPALKTLLWPVALAFAAFSTWVLWQLGYFGIWQGGYDGLCECHPIGVWHLVKLGSVSARVHTQGTRTCGDDGFARRYGFY